MQAREKEQLGAHRLAQTDRATRGITGRHVSVLEDGEAGAPKKQRMRPITQKRRKRRRHNRVRASERPRKHVDLIEATTLGADQVAIKRRAPNHAVQFVVVAFLLVNLDTGALERGHGVSRALSARSAHVRRAQGDDRSVVDVLF